MERGAHRVAQALSLEIRERRDARRAGVHHAPAGLVTQAALQLQANALLVRVLAAALEHGDHRVQVLAVVAARCSEVERPDWVASRCSDAGWAARVTSGAVPGTSSLATAFS